VKPFRALVVAAAASTLLATDVQAAGVLAIGAEKGDSSRVVLRTDPGNDGYPEIIAASFFAFGSGFKGGVRVAVGDYDGDADLELVAAPGAGMQAKVKVWDLAPNGEIAGVKESFSGPFSGLSGGLYVDLLDLDGNGKDSLVVTAGSGEPWAWIFDDGEATNPGDGLLKNSLIDSFQVLQSAFTGGVVVAGGITNPDNRADVVFANGPGNGTHVVRIWRDVDLDSMLSDETMLDEFVPTLDGPYKGMHVTVGNVSQGTTNGEIVCYVTGGGNTTIRVFVDTDGDGLFSDNQTAAENEMFSLATTKSKGGLRLTAAKFDADARAELVVASKVNDQPSLHLLEAGAAASAKLSDAGTSTVLIPYVDSLITTYFKKVPFLDWSN